METLRFKADSATRRRFFVPDSFAHPAKMASGLVLECIERYTKPGDLVLDPMAGSGTLLLGAMYGRNLILNELELHFVLPMVESWKKIQQNGPAMGHEMGQVVILRGDARYLPLPDASVGAAITSPPYEESYSRWGDAKNDLMEAKGLEGKYTRPVDAIVTSPPWEDKTALQDSQWLHSHEAELAERFRQAHAGEKGLPGNTRPENRSTMPSYTRPLADSCTQDKHDRENIGNMKGDTYWEAMRQVYAECWRVLRPGGLLCLVLKGFTRASEYVNLPAQTEALLLEAGWQKHDHWRRELWSLSFWRILQKRRDPAAFDERLKFEEVLAFRKGTT